MEERKNKKLKGLIHRISVHPFGVFLAYEEQLKVYNQLSKNKNLILFVDATGSLIKAPNSCSKKPILYYTAVTRNEFLNSIPIASSVQSKHSVEEISLFFTDILNKAKSISNVTLYPQIVTVDNSKALIAAAIKVFNGDTVTSYINKAYNFEVNKSPFQVNTVVHICTAHFVNQLMRHLPKRDKKIKTNC